MPTPHPPRRTVHLHTPALLAAALLTSPLLGACSPGTHDPAKASSRHTASPAAYPQPALRLTPDQARVVTMVGQRVADARLEEPVKSGMGALAVCPGEDAVVASKDRSWSVASMVTDLPDGLRPKRGDVARAFNGTIVLDDSPSAVRVMDERLDRWRDCASEGDDRVSSEVPHLPRTPHAVGVAREVSKQPQRSRHWYFGAARIENVFVVCETAASTPKSARASSLSCLRDMAAAVPVAVQPLDAGKGDEKIAAKAVLAGVEASGWNVVMRGRPHGGPCPSSNEAFLSGNGAVVWVQEPANDATLPPRTVGMVSAELLTDDRTAQAKVAAARTSLRECKRSWTDGDEMLSAKGVVESIRPGRFGDGGTTVAWHQTFSGSNSETHQSTAVFSVGRVVVHTQVFDQKTAAQAEDQQTALVAAVVARLEGLAGSRS